MDVFLREYLASLKLERNLSENTIASYKNDLVLAYYRRTEDLNFGTGGTSTSLLNMARIMNAFEKSNEYIDVNFSGISLDEQTNHINFSLIFKHAQKNSSE